MPDVSNRGRGDLPGTGKGAVPKKLSKDQRRLLEELATTLPQQPAEPRAGAHDEEDKGLFDRVKDIFG
jgi:DnaJ-class molecular chaperone